MSNSNQIEDSPQSLRLVKGISLVLYQHDPLRIAHEENTLEYSNEAASISAKLCAGMTNEDLSQLVDTVLSNWFMPDWYTCRPTITKALQLENISVAISALIMSDLAS